MKLVAWAAGLVALAASAAYLVVSLNRWEWNRALFFGLLLLVAEVALASALVLQRLGRLERRSEIDPDVLEAIRDSRPPSPNRFEWMKPTQMNVFITFLVGGGVVLSALAWLVDRIASTTTTPAGEEHLARLLGPISYPKGGLLLDDVTVLAQAVPGCDDTQLRKLLRHAGTGR